ncbi:LuxR family transcriptional regulator [Actinophytocola xinjiangensis]|uniref:LuxR family transcriptional regulator n=1 Tax=Actinophytocola xinjiangensis TaxID=485602 RepID=A0A7Z0WE25_9PSEU|nr:LuxR family transcriptional regulator [Actinophytocola xinjiangensis]OLF04813.1 LuxR family transcriptional regulator [Actinophytocola xinjiangensis]
MRHGSAALTGRERELRVLEDALADARIGRGGAVFLIGEPGIGKSRLAAAATESAYAAGMALMRGRASVIGPATPFRPLTEAILYLLRVNTIDQAELGPFGPILGRVVPGWGNAATWGGDGDSLVVLAEGILRLTGLAGRDDGCLLALDDLHDADAETLAVLEYLVDNLDLWPTLLIGGIRDHESTAATLARTAAQRGRCTVIELDRLPHDDLRRLAMSCLDSELPAEALRLLWAGSAGNPFMAEEMLKVMVDDGTLTRTGGTWTFTGDPTATSAGLARPLARRVANLGQRTRDVLAVAATFGSRFPLAVVRLATGLSDHVLLSLLQDDLAGQLVAPDEQTADWYTFHHQLSRDAVLAQLDREEQARLAGRVADAVDTVHPGHPGEWCEVVARLRLDAGDRETAGRLFAEAGRRALTAGGATSAVSLLDRAFELLAGDQQTRASVLEQLLLALVEAGQVERALTSMRILDQVGDLSAKRRANLHTQVAWAAAVAGRGEEALSQVAAARGLLGPSPDAADLAQVDVVAAHLALDQAGVGQFDHAERTARQAAAVAESVPLPAVACQAWQLLGAIVRHRDPAEATRCLERANSLAIQYGLPIWEIHALIRLGNDDALRTGDIRRLEQARDKAGQVGAVTAGYQAESSIALQLILRGDCAGARAVIDRVLGSTVRLRLMETTRYLLLLRVVCAAHEGDESAMTVALAEFERWGGNPTLHAPRIHGLAGAFRALLAENRSLASSLVASVSTLDGVYYLSGRHGLALLLTVLSGEADRTEHAAVAADPASALRWDRQFVLFADAVLSGREGNGPAATEAVTQALAVAEPFTMTRHLGLRLVGQAALEDGWGEPAAWLRAAESYFHGRGIRPVADACRALLRKAGAKVPQRRSGVDGIPPELRSAGVTVREYEVLGLLVGRLGNQEIAAKLHVSPRTVERHVCNLMTKTGLPNRIALGQFAADFVPAR